MTLPTPLARFATSRTTQAAGAGSESTGFQLLGRVLINPAHPMSAVGAKADVARTVLHVSE